MYELGKRSEFKEAEALKPLKKGVLGIDSDIPLDLDGNIKNQPRLDEGEKVVAGVDQGLGEHLFVCESLDDMKQVQELHDQGGSVKPIQWYKSAVN